LAEAVACVALVALGPEDGEQRTPAARPGWSADREERQPLRPDVQILLDSPTTRWTTGTPRMRKESGI
jgi:hypothetical protein